MLLGTLSKSDTAARGSGRALVVAICLNYFGCALRDSQRAECISRGGPTQTKHALVYATPILELRRHIPGCFENNKTYASLIHKKLLWIWVKVPMLLKCGDKLKKLYSKTTIIFPTAAYSSIYTHLQLNFMS